MARKPSGYFIPLKDWPDFRRLMAEFRAIGRTLRHLKGELKRRTRGGGAKSFYAKTTTPLIKGPQPTSTTVAEDKGPAWGSGGGEATGNTPEIHYLHVRNLVADEWIFCTKVKGKTYCGPIACPPPVTP